MIINKYACLLSAAAALATAPSALAVECSGNIPSVDRGSVSVTCIDGVTRAVGRANWNFAGAAGTELFYDIDLKTGVFGAGRPVRTDGSPVPKLGGGTCPILTDFVPGSPSPVSGSCPVATAFSAKKYIVTARTQ
jgi:hypothetical protein